MVPPVGSILSRVLLEDGRLVQAERGREQPRTFWNSVLLVHADSLGNEARLEETEAWDRASSRGACQRLTSRAGVPSPAGSTGPACEHTDLGPGRLLPGGLEAVTALSSLVSKKGKLTESHTLPCGPEAPAHQSPGRKPALCRGRSGHSRCCHINQPRSPHVPPELTKLPFSPSAHTEPPREGEGVAHPPTPWMTCVWGHRSVTWPLVRGPSFSFSLPPPQFQELLRHSHIGVVPRTLCLLKAYCELRICPSRTYIIP